MTTLILGAMLATQQRSFATAEHLCEVNSSKITESSGLAVSPTQPGVFYTHNDSGDGPVVYRIDKQGKVTGEFKLRGVTATDWEDMSVTRVAGTNYVFIADVGDNGRVRSNVKIYRFKEPTGPSREVTDFQTFTVRYDRDKHDCEAIVIDPQNADIYLVTKAALGSGVFYVKAPMRTGNYTAERLGSLFFNTGGLGGTLVTGGASSPDGKFVALRTYTGVKEYAVTEGFKRWFLSSKAVTFQTAIEQQGEALCYASDGKGIITSSEGKPYFLDYYQVR